MRDTDRDETGMAFRIICEKVIRTSNVVASF